MTRLAAVRLAATKPAQTAADVLIVGLKHGRTLGVEAPGLTAAMQGRLASALSAVGASGKAGEVTRIPSPSGIAAAQVIGVGLGTTQEDIRTSVGAAIRATDGRRRVAVAIPEEHLSDVALAVELGAYAFTAFRGARARTSPRQTVTILLPAAVTPEHRKEVREAQAVAQAVNLARDLVNTPPNALPPAALADAAVEAVAGLPVDVRVWDVAGLEEDGCGGILAVGQGSSRPPRLARLDYAPEDARAHLALVGKGITFDTGGISIKPADSMHEMKGDMAGAAAVIGAVRAIAELGLPIRVTGWVPAAENMPSDTAQRPGDVITIHGGTTVEVLNTDAEGRLVLADALVMAAAEKPDLIIDIATLTGAQRIALGLRTAGVMGNDPKARDAVVAAADEAGEQTWPMPLPEDLRSSLDSSVADLANIGERLGGMLTAGVFLAEFVPAEQPWVHMDIAGPAYNTKGPYGYTPAGGTGMGVRTFVQVARIMAED